MLNDPKLASSAGACSRGTGGKIPWLRRALLAFGAAALLSLAACATPSGAPSLQGKPRSGHVEMSQVQAAYIGSGSAGHGILRYRGHAYPFTVGGLGIGGIGASTIQAKGDVYPRIGS